MSPRACLLVVMGLSLTGPALASPATPTARSGFVLRAGWPGEVGISARLAGKELTPFLSGGWRYDVDLLTAEAGAALTFLDLGWGKLRTIGGGGGLLGLGEQLALGGRGFFEGQAVLSWRWLHAYAGPRFEAATTVGKRGSGRITPLGVVGAGVVVAGLGLWLRAAGGYSFSGLFSGGLTGRAEVALSVPLGG